MEPKTDFNPWPVAAILFLAATILLLCAAVRFFGGNPSGGIRFLIPGGILLGAGGVMLQQTKSR